MRNHKITSIVVHLIRGNITLEYTNHHIKQLFKEANNHHWLRYFKGTKITVIPAQAQLESSIFVAQRARIERTRHVERPSTVMTYVRYVSVHMVVSGRVVGSCRGGGWHGGHGAPSRLTHLWANAGPRAPHLSAPAESLHLCTTQLSVQTSYELSKPKIHASYSISIKFNHCQCIF